MIIGMALALWSCQSDASSDRQADEQAVAAQPAKQETAAPKAEQSGLYSPPRSSDVLFLQLGQQEAPSGTTVCVPVIARGFHSLLSMQYTIAWDPDVLAFKEVKGFGLPHLSAQNFGTTRTAEGVLPVVWIDNALKGVTVSDGSPLYSVCFEVKGGSGQRSPVQIVDTPTAIEVVNLGEQIVGLDSEAGAVTVK